MTGSETDAAGFGPHVLREYALVADGERGGLIGPHGELTWMCAPRWDSDAVFSDLIGGRGVYAVTPADPRHVWGGYYEPGSLIWRSRWITAGAVIECREALAFPGDPERIVLLRQVHAVRGDARLRIVLEPRAGFGRHGSHSLSREADIWSGTTGRLHWRWQGGGQARPHPVAHGRGELLVLELTVPAGGRHDLVLEIGEGIGARDLPDPDRTWRATESAWARNRPSLEHTIAQRDAQHAWAVLRGLTSSGGGMATLQVVRDELARDEYIYRFRHDQRPLGDAEGAFVLCGFIMALAEHQQGHELAAARYFERNRAACGPPGLLSEEYDVTQRQLRGNLPQAFVHAQLLECAAVLTGGENDEG